MANLPGCVCRTLRTAVHPARAPRGLSTCLPAVMHQSSSRTLAANIDIATSVRHASSYARPLRPRLAPRSASIEQRRSMFVQTETTPNEDSLKFIPGMTLSESGQTHEFLSTSDAIKSPLASSLFEIPGVRLVFFGPDFLTVSKAEDTQWAILKPEIYSRIIEHFSQGKPLFYDGSGAEDGPEDTRILDTDTEVVAMVKELLDTRVRPAVQEDGGNLMYRGMTDEGIVKISLHGSCKGCSSSSVTLKNGIERMLMHYIPEVKGVEQVLSEEEKVSTSEFEKFEARLRQGAKTVEI